MIIEIISFGFKTNDIPNTNYLIDVRFLNNPFYVDELKELTGLDEEVINFFKTDQNIDKFLNNLFAWVEYILKSNKYANKEKIIISIGCTGGQHRSPYITECLARYLTDKDELCHELSVRHRELKKYNILKTKKTGDCVS